MERVSSVKRSPSTVGAIVVKADSPVIRNHKCSAVQCSAVQWIGTYGNESPENEEAPVVSHEAGTEGQAAPGGGEQEYIGGEVREEEKVRLGLEYVPVFHPPDHNARRHDILPGVAVPQVSEDWGGLHSTVNTSSTSLVLVLLTAM